MIHKNNNKDFKSFKSNGTTYHTFNNKFHNWDGPAIIYENGDMEYYIYGMKHTKKEFEARIADIKLNQNATSIPKNI
jgi:hypothetical protein